MNTALIVVICIACAYVGYLCGTYIERSEENKLNALEKPADGVIIVNGKDGEAYCSFKEEPINFQDGSVLTLRVMALSEAELDASQQKQSQ